MIKLFRSILAANRKRRSRVAALILWLLRLIRDVEETEMYRYSDELDKINLVPEKVPRRDYNTVEEECFSCECALGFLECAIDDLKFAY